MKVTVFEKTEPTLEEAQDLVEGYVERIALENGDVLLVNEEGRLENLDLNFEASKLVGIPIVGNAVVVKKEIIKNW